MSITSSVTISDPTNALGARYNAFVADANAAAHDWLKWFIGTASIEIQINMTSLPDHPTANGGWNASTSVGMDGSRYILQSGVESEILTGTDPNGATADAFINVDTGWMAQSWVNPTPGTGTTPANQIDAMSWLRHEIGHALGIGGWRLDSGALDPIRESQWDKLVQVRASDGAAFFIGAHAEAVFGGPVPVTTLNNGEAYFHFGNSTSDSLYNDLMEGVSTQWGKSYPVSALDLAVMKDLGYNMYHAVYEGGNALEAHAYRACNTSGLSAGTGTLSNADGLDSLTNVNRAYFTDGHVEYNGHDTGWEVARFYNGILGRDFDGGGLAHWVNAVDSGALNLTQLANVLSAAGHGSETDKQFVDDLYHTALNRAPEASGESYWTNSLAQGVSRGAIAAYFCDTPDLTAKVAAQHVGGLFVEDLAAAQVARLYDATFQRAPDDGGLNAWTGVLHAGASLSSIAASFIDASVYRSLDNPNFVDQLYVNTLGRHAEASGQAYWVSVLNQGVSRADLLVGFSELPEHQAHVQPHLDNGFLLA